MRYGSVSVIPDTVEQTCQRWENEGFCFAPRFQRGFRGPIVEI